MSGPVRVIKLGGSLLDWPDLADMFCRWLAKQSPATNVVVAGGGAIVEALRQLDRAQAMPPETAHWLAIHAMSMTAALAAELLPDASLVHRANDLLTTGTAGVRVFDVADFMRDDAQRKDRLPYNWDVTSDSIAARVACRLEAHELVLLKSTLPADGATRKLLADQGFVDVHFPVAAASLPVRCVNLRHRAFPQAAL